MDPKKKKRPRKLPRSYDELIDTEFRMVVFIIRNVVGHIKAKKVLRHPDDRRTTLYGLLIDDVDIWVSVGKRYGTRLPAARIILHEALHIAHNRFVREPIILAKERVLWARLTEEQKRFLRRFVPQRTTEKKEPPK